MPDQVDYTYLLQLAPDLSIALGSPPLYNDPMNNGIVTVVSLRGQLTFWENYMLQPDVVIASITNLRVAAFKVEKQLDAGTKLADVDMTEYNRAANAIFSNCMGRPMTSDEQKMLLSESAE